tara:strand:- start:5307 stop:6125 length:819 start_codon:yes stop_codon:yes gene_type:complete
MKTHIIKFFHKNPVIIDMYPAVLGKYHTMDWIKKEQELRKGWTEKQNQFKSSVLRCPGIFEMYNRGFFIQMPYDINFTVKKGDDDVYYEHPTMDGILGSYKEEESYGPISMSYEVTFHKKTDDFLIDFPFREGTIPYICNIKTGFSFISEVPLLFLPIPYSEQNEWESSMGILETNKNIEVNPQIYLNNYHGEDEKTWNIKAGDHIMFIVPLTNDKWVLESELSLKDRIWLEAYRIVQSGSNVVCPREDARYNSILPRMKKTLNEAFKRLWN